MNKLLSTLPKIDDPNLLVGFSGSDDAGVYRLNDQMALVTTADFITPPVDDPYLFGQIAAANAMSDVYAMGGKPLVCLNLVCFPSNKLPDEVLHRIVAGALSKITEAGALLAGGHSVDDDEPKFGLAVTGMVHPDKIWTNAGAKPEDVLILTKPLGSGVLFNADLKNWVSKAAMEECIGALAALNKMPAEIMSAFDIHAATDVTGFGLAGHCLETDLDLRWEKRILLNYMALFDILRQKLRPPFHDITFANFKERRVDLADTSTSLKPATRWMPYRKPIKLSQPPSWSDGNLLFS